MTLRLFALGLFCLVVVGCTADRKTTSSIGATASTATKSRPSVDASASSDFQVAVVEAPTGDGNAPCSVQPLRLRGRTLLSTCSSLLDSHEDGVAPNTDLSSVLSKAGSGHVEGDFHRIFGRWPDDAWMKTSERVEAGVRSRAYHWRAGRWLKVAEWLGSPLHVASWRDGAVVDRVDHPGAEYVDTKPSPLAFFGADAIEKAPPPSRLLALPTADPNRQAILSVDDLVSVDGTLFLVAQPGRPNRLMVERWRVDAPTSQTYSLTNYEATARLWTMSDHDIVAYGGATFANEKPLLRHFDGEQWAPIEAPPGVDIIVGYDRSPSGAQLAFAYRGKELSCWTSSPGSPWRSLSLPMLGPGETIGGHWITDGDAWLHIDDVNRRAGRLLRLRPVKHVLRVSEAGSEESPVSDYDRVPAATADAAASSAIDPSPFHDAVVGFPDGPNAALPNTLTLCPASGRTRVCGVTAVPLLSADDGVVRADGRTDDEQAQPPVGRVGPGRSGDTLLKRLDGGRLARLRLPAGIDRVVAYDRSPNGTERFFAYVGETLALYERARATEPWRTIQLPALADGASIHDVWLVNDDAWLLIWPKDLVVTPARLMRLRPVKKLWSYPRELPALLGW